MCRTPHPSPCPHPPSSTPGLADGDGDGDKDVDDDDDDSGVDDVEGTGGCADTVADDDAGATSATCAKLMGDGKLFSDVNSDTEPTAYRMKVCAGDGDSTSCDGWPLSKARLHDIVSTPPVNVHALLVVDVDGNTVKGLTWLGSR